MVVKWKVLLLGTSRNFDGPCAQAWMHTYGLRDGKHEVFEYEAPSRLVAEEQAKLYNEQKIPLHWMAYAVQVDEHGNIIEDEQ